MANKFTPISFNKDVNLFKRAIGLFSGLFLGVSSAHAAALKVGDVAPDFTAPSSTGESVHLAALVGAAPIVLYFYPRDNTPGCTKEACGLRDHFAAFRHLNARVFGISYDSVASHRAFAKKFNLPFALLADTDKTIARRYGADGILFARHMTFVIDKQGKVAWINPSVNPATHSAELEKVLTSLSAG